MAQTKTASFFEHFAQVIDPRVNRRRRHHLLDILLIALCATIGGADDFLAIEVWGKERRGWLSQYLELPNGIPSHDTFNRLFHTFDPGQFLNCFRNWVKPLCESLGVKLIGIDGKTTRATLDRKKGKNPLHIVSAWALGGNAVSREGGPIDES